MIYLILTILTLTNLGVLLFLYRQWVSRRVFNNELRGFTEPKGPGETSPLADIAQVFADMLGRSITVQLKTTFMGVNSANARSETALENDIKGAALATNPTIAGLLSSVPALRKSLRKNPGLMDVVLQALANKPGLFGGQGGPDNGQSSQVNFIL